MADEPQALSDTLSLETEKLRGELTELNRLGGSFGGTIARAFSSGISGGRKFSDVLQGLALSLSHQALTAALKPIGTLFSGALGSVTPFAKGGVVNSPLLFPMAGGTGMAGEAGAEAILPLARDRSGRLGVRAGESGAVNVTVNIAARDVESFRQSQGQIAAAMARAIERGQRNL
ncbi:phage tail tape measure protein [soil metagenome]